MLSKTYGFRVLTIPSTFWTTSLLTASVLLSRTTLANSIWSTSLAHQPMLVVLCKCGLAYRVLTALLHNRSTHKSVMLRSSCGSTSSPKRSVKKSVVSKSPMNVVQSTTETQVSRRATLDNPPFLIS